MCLHQIGILYQICGFAVSLQKQASILAVVPFRIFYIANLLFKYVLIYISGNSIRTQTIDIARV